MGLTPLRRLCARPLAAITFDLRVGRPNHGAMLVTLIQGVIRAFNEDLTPLNDDRGSKTSQGAEDNFLGKRGVHAPLDSSAGASLPKLPKTPLFCFHDPESQQQIGNCVSEDTRGKAPRSVGHAVIKHAGNQRRDPIWFGMGKPKCECGHSE